MSKGHPYRYDQGHYDRNRCRFGQDGRRDLVPPYKRQRRSSGNDFTTFSYDDCNQEVGLGNFNDFSAIKREAILPRDRHRESKPPSSQSTLTVQTIRSNTASKSSSKISPLSVNISPSSHGTSKPQMNMTPSSTSSSLLSSFQRPSPQLVSRSQPTSPVQTGTISQHGSRTEPSQSPGHSFSLVYPGSKPDQPTGLLMQANSSDITAPSHVPSNPDSSIKEEVYQPKVEAVSPTNSEAEVDKPGVEPTEEADQKKRSDELLKQMEKVDKEISEVEKKISDLRDKQKTLEDELSQDALHIEEEEEEEKENENTTQDNGIEEKKEVETTPSEPKEKALIERIYEENRKKAAAAHERFAKLGIPLPNAMPIYNQPSDLPFYEENRKKARAVQLKLVKYFQRKRKDKQIKQRALLEQYRDLHKKWMEKVEKIENNQKRKNREGKIRDSYEKIFPEIKRHREQTERFSRIGSRNWGMSARSDAEYEEILKDLEEKERHEKHMRLLAVDPPPLLDEDQRRVKYINRNGLIKDLHVYVEQHKMLNIWTEEEKEIFKERYIEAPKDFEFIARFIPNKTVKDCVLYYYLTKRKTGDYKKLAKKQSLKRKRLTNSTGKDETSKSKILKPRTEGSRSESDMEEEEAFDMDSDGSEGSSSRVPITSSSNTPGKITTAQTGNKTPGAEAGSVETPRWSTSEREIAIEGLRLHGRNWTAISQMVKTKTEAQCKNFYFNYKRKLDLENVIAEHNASKVVQRRESEETISASEASDDNYEVAEERPSIVRNKQLTRETRSQAAERRADSAPSLRISRSSRNSRNQSSDRKSSRGSTDDLSNTQFREVENQESSDKSKMSTSAADEAQIIVLDTVEPQGQGEVVRGIIGSREHPRSQISPFESYMRTPVSSSIIFVSEGMHVTGSTISTSLATQSQAVTKVTNTSSDRQLMQSSTKMETQRSSNFPSSTDSQKVKVDSPNNPMYPNIPYKPLTPAGRHSEALQNLARRNAAAEGRLENTVEEFGDKDEKEKLKRIRVPDPELHKVERDEAIGKFTFYSPCIPPDTTSIQQVRNQRFPPQFHHPSAMPIPFVPLGPHAPTFYPSDIFPVPFPHGPGFEHMYPHYVEYLHPGMDHNLYSARLREEAARANSGGMWPHIEHQLLITPHGPYMFPLETLPPGEPLISRRREGGHELISPVSSTRCRSVETPAMHPRTPEQISISTSKTINKPRSMSLTDVHSRSVPIERHVASPGRLQAKPSSKEPTDQVKSYEPFTALMNAAAGARPISSSSESGRESQQENKRSREQPKPNEADRSNPQFTRQSCVVTNTSVLHVMSGPKETSGSQAHGISSGLAPRQPPPLLSITGSHPLPSRSDGASNSRLVEKHNIGRVKSRETQDSLVEPPPTHVQHQTRGPPQSFSPNPKEQHPPPLVRDTFSVGLRRTPPIVPRDIELVGHHNPDILPCGCRSTEPCKHQLYSQEVPYVQRMEEKNRSDVEAKHHGLDNNPTIFRPWSDMATRKSPSPIKKVSPPVQFKQTLLSQQPQTRLSISADGRILTPPNVLYHHQQPGMVISHSRPSLGQPGKVAPRTEKRDDSFSHYQDDSLSKLQELGQRSTSSRPSLLEPTPRPSLMQGQSITHLPKDTSLHPRQPTSKSRSPHPPQSISCPTSSQRTIREPSSQVPPPLMCGVNPGTPPRHILSPMPQLPYHQDLLNSKSRSSPPPHIEMSYPVSHPSGSNTSHVASIITPSHTMVNRPTSQEPKGTPNLVQSHQTPFPPRVTSSTSTSQHIPHPPDPTSLSRDGPRLPFPSYEMSRSSGQPRSLSEQARRASDSSRFLSEPSLVLSERSRAVSQQPRTLSAPSLIVSDAPRGFSKNSRTSSEQSHGVSMTTSFTTSASPKQKSMSPGPLIGMENQTSPFPEQVEFHKPSFDTPVDIKRHINPSYAGKNIVNRPNTETFMDANDISTLPADEKGTGKLSPAKDVVAAKVDTSPELSSALVDPEEIGPSPSESDPTLSPREMKSNPSLKKTDSAARPEDIVSSSSHGENDPDLILEKTDSNLSPREMESSSSSLELDTNSSPKEMASNLSPGKVKSTKSPEEQDSNFSPEMIDSNFSSEEESNLIPERSDSNLSMTEVDTNSREATFESHEDIRSIAGSSSVGFESPDDEDHELRMRYFPPGDYNDRTEDSLYNPEDSSQQVESDSGGDTLCPHKGGDEFSNTDGTFIPTDSTYLGYAGHSSDDTGGNHGLDSSDMVLSDLSESEKENGKLVRRSGVDTRFGNLGARSRDRQKESEMLSQDETNNDIVVQDETASGIEGDDDASDEDEAGYSGIETSSVGDVGMATVQEKSAKSRENEDVEEIGGDEIVRGTDDDGEAIVVDRDAGIVDTEDGVIDAENEGANIPHDKQGHATEPADLIGSRESEGDEVERSDSISISGEDECLNSSGDVLNYDDSNRENSETDDNKIRQPTANTSSLTDHQTDQDTTSEGLTTTEDVSSCMTRNDDENMERKINDVVITDGTTSIAVPVTLGQSSNGSKEVSSSSDSSQPILDESNDEAVEDHDNCDVSENEATRDAAGVLDSVDSSTDREDGESKALHEDDPELNQATPGRLKNVADEPRDRAELRADSGGPVLRDLANSEAHVTSSIEHVIRNDELVTDEGEHVESSDGHGDGESHGIDTSESRAEENETRRVEITDLHMDTNDAQVTSAQGILMDSVEKSVDNEDGDMTRNLKEKNSEAMDTNHGQNTQRIDNSENIIESTWNQPSGILRDQPDQETSNDISSTVEELHSQNSFTGITSSNPETGDQQLEFSLPEENERASSSENLSYVVSTSSQRDEIATSSVSKQRDHVDTTGVAKQDDDIATSSGIPNISDVSSSDTSECAENAYEPESRSSQIDLPDSADDVREATGSSETEFPDSGRIVDGRYPRDLTYLRNRNLVTISRRSSKNSPGYSEEEPSTTNFDEPTISGSFTDNHESVRGNEAESLNNEEDEFRTEGNMGGFSLTERDNIVDSSTVSPVSVTDDISRDNASGENMEHLGADMDSSEYGTTVDIGGYLGLSVRGVRKTCDTSSDMNIVDTTRFLGMNEDYNGFQNTAGTSADTTGYLGLSEDSTGTLIAPEDSVGTSMGITSSTKYDIAVEAISSDEEELEEGEIAETLDDATRNDVTTSPCDVTPEHIITSSSESYYPPDTIPISPPADSDEPSSSFLDFGAYTYPSTQLAGSSTQLAGSNVPHSVFPFSALNLRSAPSSNCSSPVQIVSGCNTPIRYQQADSTPIIFQPADSSNMLTPQYEPLSDDDSSEAHDPDK